MTTKFFTITFFIIISLININCGGNDDSVSSDDSVTGGTNSINFESALLKTFPLSEVDENPVENISIKQPTLLNGIPQNKGEIKIQLAYTEISKFSLKQVDFNSSDFKISPDIGEQSIIPDQNTTYTITSLKDPSVSMQYDVLITIKKLDPKDEKLGINGFRFLKSNNAALSEDIISTEIRKYRPSHIRDAIIAIIVPVGTDFSKLIPTIDFEGSLITYYTATNGNDSDFKEFTNGTSLNFKYPNIITFRIYNSDKSRSYKAEVYVDIKNPIVFAQPSITINNGNVVSRFNIFQNVIGFTNQGNYPIEHSNIGASEIKVTETAETTPTNYYTNISLRTDKKVHTGEKGRLYVQTNFPANFVGPGRESIRGYIVNATFKTMHNLGKIITFDTASSVNGTDFYIYDPVEIEIKANVFVFNN